MRAYKDIMDLSTELLVDILCILHVTTMVQCRRICKRFMVIIDKTPSLQYSVELAAAGYHLDAPKTTGVTDALATFRRIQKIYRNPFPQPLYKLDLGFCGPSLHARFWAGSVWSVYDDLLVGKAPRDTTLGFLSLRPDVPEKDRFRCLKFGFAIDHFHVDLRQDLLVLCSLDKVHVRRLSTGEVHSKLRPRAEGSSPILLQHVPAARSTWDIFTWRNWLLVCAQFYRAGETIWSTYLCHWPTGTMRKIWTSLASGGCIVPGYVIIAVADEAGDHDPRVEVYRLPDEDTDDKPILVAKYLMPPRDHVESGPLHPILHLSAMAPRTSYLSKSNGGVDVGLLELSYCKPYSMWLPVSALLTPAVRDHDGKTAPQSYPWTSWGPTRTRYLERVRAWDLIGASGMRLVSPEGIFDFNSYDMANNIYAPPVQHGRKLRGMGKNYSGAVHTETSDLIVHASSKCIVMQTGLPYRTMIVNFPRPAWGMYDRHYLVEQEDGPKITRVAFTGAGTPKYLQFYKL